MNRVQKVAHSSSTKNFSELVVLECVNSYLCQQSVLTASLMRSASVCTDHILRGQAGHLGQWVSALGRGPNNNLEGYFLEGSVATF
jgi:hypothetical protein